jgi:histidinol-phosphatase (PHP family)
MFDTHVHTKISSDSKMEIEEAIKSAKDKNLSLILTEHMDLKAYEDGSFCFNPKEYFNKYSNYRNNNLLLGIEIGMKYDCIEENREIVKNNHFDYVIGSIHLVYNMDIYYKEYYHEKSKKQAYEAYFEHMLNCVKQYDFIDSMGHIDYIARYGQFQDKEIYYKEFSDIIDGILKELLEKDKCIELNTRRFNDKNAIKNSIPIYKRFRELGGKDITVGSDAHHSVDIGNNFDVAREISDLCNLKIVYFKERKKEYEKI